MMIFGKDFFREIPLFMIYVSARMCQYHTDGPTNVHGQMYRMDMGNTISPSAGS